MTGAQPQASLPRYHSLDRLRASMMMLGVVRHAAMSYVPTVFEWPYRDAQADMLSYWVVLFIRVFHLPVFFAIAGFFAAYLIEKRGTREFLRHRWSRIGVPFVVAWPVLAVTMFFIVPFAARFSYTPPNATYSISEWTSPRALDHLFMHLWFLYHLMILCVVASALRPLAARIPAGVRDRAMDLFERWVHHGGIAVLILATGFILYRMESWAIDYYAGPFPAPRQLALYGLFFGFGWMLFRRRGTLEGFKRPAWVLLAAGMLCFFVYRHWFEIGCPPRPDRKCTGAGEEQHLPAVVFLALSMWFMAYGLIGLFQRYLDQPSPRWRYMADASYWIYIVHVPFVMLLPLLLASVPLPAIVKLALVSVTAVGLILLTYGYFVRPTFIGKQTERTPLPARRGMTEAGGGDGANQHGGPIAYMARNGVAANLLMVGILAAGLLSLGSLDQEVLPEHSLDRIQVSVPYPGASPVEVDESIVSRIEERIRSIEGVRSVTSVASEGLGSVVAELRRSADADRAREEIKAVVDGIQAFPAGAERPAVAEMTSRRSVLRIALHGDVQERTLKELAHRVEDELSSLPAVSHVRTSSVRDYEISIEVPAGRLNALGLTLSDVAAAVRSGTLELSAGSIDTRDERVRIRTAGRSYDQHDFENIIVLGGNDGTTVRLGDIAEVRDGFAEGGLVSRYNGQPAAFIEVYRTADERVLDISEAVERQLRERVAPGLPPGVGVDIWSNDADPLAARLGLMLKNGFLGLLLVLAVLALFLELRLACWVATGIAVSFVGTLAVMAVLEVSINLTSLFAFILAVGIVVDDAVVVGENIAAERERGYSGLAAAIRGTRRVRAPVTFGVLTTVAAFLPLLFLPSSVGAMAEAIPVIVISVLLFSLLESLLVLPNHLSRLSAGTSASPGGRSAEGLHRRTRARVNRELERFVNGPLDRLLRLATARPGIAITTGVGVLIVCIAMIPAGIVGVAFTPTVEGNLVTATLEMPEGTPRARTASVAQELEDAGRRAVDRLSAGLPERAEPLLTAVAITLGGTPTTLGSAIVASGGAPETGPRSHMATVQFRLIDAERRTIAASALQQAWREETGEIAGHRSLSFSANLVDLGRPVHVELAHPDPVRLTAIADTVAEFLRGQAGVFDVRSDQDQGVREVQLELKPEARTLGLTLDNLARQVRAAFFGEEVVRLQRGREEIRVYARLPERERNAIADLETYQVRTPAGGAVHLGRVAAARFGNSPTVIRRRDGNRVATVTADAQALATQPTTQRLATVLREMSARDPGLEHSFEGERREVSDSMGALGSGFALALLAIYALLAIPFGSYVRPLIVMAAIPFGLVGAVLGHLLLGFEIAATSIFGFVGLSGVVVNDSIVMIDFITERRRAGMPIREAIIGGAKARFRPIFLTSLTTFLGVAPLILEQDLQARFLIPMAASLGFGIIAATGVLMVIVPALATLQMGQEAGPDRL